MKWYAIAPDIWVRALDTDVLQIVCREVYTNAHNDYRIAILKHGVPVSILDNVSGAKVWWRAWWRVGGNFNAATALAQEQAKLYKEELE